MTRAGGRTAVLAAAAALGAVLGPPAAGAGAVPWPAPASPVTAGPAGPGSTYNTLTGVSADSASDA